MLHFDNKTKKVVFNQYLEISIYNNNCLKKLEEFELKFDSKLRQYHEKFIWVKTEIESNKNTIQKLEVSQNTLDHISTLKFQNSALENLKKEMKKKSDYYDKLLNNVDFCMFKIKELNGRKTKTKKSNCTNSRASNRVL